MTIRPDILFTFDLAKFSGTAMGVIFTVWLIVFILLGIVLSFHWRQYSYNVFGAWLFTFLYFTIGIALLIAMAAAQF